MTLRIGYMKSTEVRDYCHQAHLDAGHTGRVPGYMHTFACFDDSNTMVGGLLVGYALARKLAGRKGKEQVVQVTRCYGESHDVEFVLLEAAARNIQTYNIPAMITYRLDDEAIEPYIAAGWKLDKANIPVGNHDGNRKEGRMSGNQLPLVAIRTLREQGRLMDRWRKNLPTADAPIMSESFSQDYIERAVKRHRERIESLMHPESSSPSGSARERGDA